MDEREVLKIKYTNTRVTILDDSLLRIYHMGRVVTSTPEQIFHLLKKEPPHESHKG